MKIGRKKREREKLTALQVSGYTGPIDRDASQIPDIREWLAAPLTSGDAR